MPVAGVCEECRCDPRVSPRGSARRESNPIYPREEIESIGDWRVGKWGLSPKPGGLANAVHENALTVLRFRRIVAYTCLNALALRMHSIEGHCLLSAGRMIW